MRRFWICIFALAVSAASAQRRPAEVILTAPSVAERHRSVHTPEAESYGRALRQGKAGLVAGLVSRGAPLDYQLETVLNAIIIEATEEDLAWLRTQPGVRSAEFSRAVHMHLDFATALIGAPAIWSQLGGSDQAGRGIKVGIIDSGIDQTHPMFSDSGFTPPPGFPRFDTTADKAFTTNKVVVARNFTTESNVQDGAGHGTFVASVVAGRATATPVGTTISGVAPGAWLGSYKVFTAAGTGSQSSVLAALDTAISDGMDIVNFSGGSEPGVASASDSLAAAVRNANALGMVIVVAAGNCGPKGDTTAGTCPTLGDFSIASPGDVSAVITAGASTNGHVLAHSLQVTSSGAVPATLQNTPFSAGDTPPFTAALGPAGMVDITPFDSTSLGCGTLPAGSVNGKVAVIRRGTCTFSVKIAAAAQAGAIGVLLYDNVTEALPGISTPASAIPSGIISAVDGAALLAFLAVQPDAQVTMGATLFFVTRGVIADLVSNYSSRGPSPDYTIKPDLLAPGDMYGAAQSTNSAGLIYSANRFVSAQGTSFASPMTAGSAAVLKGARPTLTPTDIKSALVNNATPVTATQDGALVSVMNGGAGRLNLPAAMATTLTSDPVSISFGVIAQSSASQSQALTLKNIGTQTETFDVVVNPVVSDPGLQVSTDLSSVTLGGGQTGTLNVRIATSAAEQGIFEGFISLQSHTTTTLIRIPYWMMFGTPMIPFGGLVDGAGFGRQVAPGEIVSLFGTSLGARGVGASTIPLPTDVGHTVVSIAQGGSKATQAPIFYSSTGQVNLQLPFTLTPSLSATVSVALEGIVGNSLIFAAVAAAPGIFTDGKGGAIALHQDFTLISAASPARGGEPIQIYCTGLGAVTPAVAAGAAGPIRPLSVTPVSPTVMIGSQIAPVSFSGLAPTFAGLYQVNVQVPMGLPSGAQALTMTMSGVASNPVTINVQ